MTKLLPYRVIYFDEVKQDIKEAKAWYKKQSNGLQKKFTNEVINAIERLQSSPESYAIRYRKVRIVHTRTFPFGIHFKLDIENRCITIIAVVHDHRDIGEIEKRK